MVNKYAQIALMTVFNICLTSTYLTVRHIREGEYPRSIKVHKWVDVVGVVVMSSLGISSLVIFIITLQ